MLYLQIASPKSSVLNFLDSNSFEVIISIFQRTEKVPDMERLQPLDPIWHDFDIHSMHVLIQDYIAQKAEEDSRPLLLFLFGFTPSVEIEGHLYSVNEKPHPIGPLRKACFRLFPELIKFLYDNDCIPDTDEKSLFEFLCYFTKSNNLL